MEDSELPATQAERVDWVIRAPNNREMQRRYDLWAACYDADIGSMDDYLAPIMAVKVAREHFEPSALIMDAGAGTGLVGQALKDEGFQNLVAVDYSSQMLEIAERKGLYTQLCQCDLSQPTNFEADSFDGVITCGTTSQMPSASLQEFTRLVKNGGKIIFAVLPDQWKEFGYADVLSELEKDGRLSLVSRGKPFQMMPTTEPHFYCEIWVIAVH